MQLILDGALKRAKAIDAHPVEKIGAVLRGHMTAMKQVAVGG